MNLNDYEMTLLNGRQQPLGEFQNKVVLIVNTASECGFTSQYEGLETLYQTYKEEGLVVLGFPCNQFGHQEPGDSHTIGAFCQKNYGVSFPMFEKIDVNGDNAALLFNDLKSAAPGMLGSKAIKWNFTKFLINPAKGSVKRFSPKTKPKDIELDIKLALKHMKKVQEA
ncbi:glutathione peroxidase [Candidatus Sororendozoicomonas aggregata]|uniref:glutathione peroxidase n=1 Tax=Candidatus Sororendozoicomonas aggregata TaxID=3073239 RepID=UPI002ED331CF